MAEKKATTKKAAPKKTEISAEISKLLDIAKKAYRDDESNSEWVGVIDLLEKAWKISLDKKLLK